MTAFRTTRVFSAPAEAAFEDAAIAANIRRIVPPANEQNLDRWESAVRAGGGGSA